MSILAGKTRNGLRSPQLSRTCGASAARSVAQPMCSFTPIMSCRYGSEEIAGGRILKCSAKTATSSGTTGSSGCSEVSCPPCTGSGRSEGTCSSSPPDCTCAGTGALSPRCFDDSKTSGVFENPRGLLDNQAAKTYNMGSLEVQKGWLPEALRTPKKRPFLSLSLSWSA